MVKTLFTIFLVLTSGFRYFWKWWNIRKKGALKSKIEASVYPLNWGFKKIFIYTMHLAAKVLQNDAKSRYTKAGFKTKITGIWTTLDKQWKVQKVEIWWAFLQKNTFLQLKDYIQWICLTLDIQQICFTFNYFCVDSPNRLCHFWNHKSFFTTHLLCIFLAQTLHTFYKGKFSDFTLLRLKFTKFLMSFFK